MLLISAENLTKKYPGKTCFADATFQIHSDMKIGFIGRNGTGKTSLFKVFCREEDFDGSLTIPKGIKILKLEQNPVFKKGFTIKEVLFEHLAEIAAIERDIIDIHHRLSEPNITDNEQQRLLEKLEKLDHEFELKNGHDIERQAVAILDGLGLKESRINEPVDILSGGEKNRLALAILLNQDADLWLFDEPTNHLDISGIEFFEKFLSNTDKGFMLISHDRRFLDKTTNNTFELENKKITVYKLPFIAYQKEKIIRQKAAENAFQKQQVKIKHEEDFIIKYGAGQRSKQAKGRSKRLNRLSRIENPRFKESLLKLRLPPCPDYGNVIINIEDLSFGYSKKLLLNNLNLEVIPGETLGIVGPNGCGKSTLFKILTGAITGYTGNFKWGKSVKYNYFEQNDTIKDESATPLDFMKSITTNVVNQELRNTLAALMFFQDAIENPINTLSGGEKKKLLMAKLLFSESNLLLLDEPTNHLDIDSREAIECVLSAFSGTLLVISHDRFFLDRIADRVLWIDHNYCKITEGGYSEAEAERKRFISKQNKAQKIAIKTNTSKPNKKATSKGPYSRTSIENLELKIIECEESLTKINEKFLLPDYYADAEKVKKLNQQMTTIKEQLSELEREYSQR